MPRLRRLGEGLGEGLVSTKTDRIEGALVGLAVGDALGAGYEFGPPVTGEISMIGGGPFGFAPGEWTDDTQMAICIAQASSPGSIDLLDVGERFIAWAAEASDIGVQTRRVLSNATRAADLPIAAARYHHKHPNNSAGNGSLMRTGPVALPYLGGAIAQLVEAARKVSDLTHADPQCADACILWSTAIARAIDTGTLPDVRDGIDLLPVDRQDRWAEIIDVAEERPPETFTPNGYVAAAFQAAWSSIKDVPLGDDHYRDGVKRVIRIGHDTDTTAAIAGALLGATYGANAIPTEWLDAAHGWPGLKTEDLRGLARTAAGAES
jgi:ADP-ribosyl-[dinitrogen reductase] hydrolase